MTDKTQLPAISVGKLFTSTIANIAEVRNQLDFTGTVDVGVTLNTTLKDNTGVLLVPFKGKDTSHSTIEVKLATRIHLSEVEKTLHFIYQGELRLGDKGPKVKALQRKLNQLLNLSLKVDGDFGKNTADAVKAFKYLQNLPFDSVLDEVAGMKLMKLSHL
ncbi:hypothetical protein RJ45_21395 [Photobacterium gaetbulicola]|uniref:Peptidoglycan binding-like domain-containing protein n=1 Tax=Photobacterium gaetbulicola TaxID=1295392 RepID=A0A0B9G9S1_9GAMM|nr:peptidoglycan-binding domain-containing protein [Photobacterium gaetbulicola]KHT61670.1 hypothetical protein RJ45_21395 [Photobacterium gaetbulicola]